MVAWVGCCRIKTWKYEVDCIDKKYAFCSFLWQLHRPIFGPCVRLSVYKYKSLKVPTAPAHDLASRASIFSRLLRGCVGRSVTQEFEWRVIGWKSIFVHYGSCQTTLQPSPTQLLFLPTRTSAPAHPQAITFWPCIWPCSYIPISGLIFSYFLTQ